MQVGTGKSVLNGIAIGKLKIYKKKIPRFPPPLWQILPQSWSVLKLPARRPLSSRPPCMKRRLAGGRRRTSARSFNIHA